MKDNGLTWLVLIVLIATFLQTHGINSRKPSSGAEFIQALGTQLHALVRSTKGLKGLNLNLTINGLSIGTNNRSYGINGVSDTHKERRAVSGSILGRPSASHNAPIQLRSDNRPYDTTAAMYNWSQFYA